MDATIANMTMSELHSFVEAIVEQKLLEILDDLDQELTLKESVATRLRRQMDEVAQGQRGKLLDDMDCQCTVHS